jgi:atypical dual specificity phosphatase
VERSASAFFVADLQPDLAVGILRPYLLLGSQDAAADAHVLGREGVTHVLDVAGCGLPEIRLQGGRAPLQRRAVALLDVPEAASALAEALPQCTQFIDEAKEKGGRVLLHW